MLEWQNKDRIEERRPTAAVKKTQAVSGVTRGYCTTFLEVIAAVVSG